MGKKLTISEIENWVETNSDCKFISVKQQQMSGINHWYITVECICGEEFTRRFNDFKRQKDKRCLKCLNRELHIYEEVKNFIEVECNDWIKLKLIDKEYKQYDKKLNIIDNYGYKYYISLHGLTRNRARDNQIAIVGTYNPYSIDNINNYLKINKSNYKLLSKTYIDTESKLLWECDKGHIFKKSWANFRQGQRCTICNETLGEKFIRDYFVNNNINYIYQHKFSNCKYINVLEFDFYLQIYNICFEYQGIQHYEPVDFAGKGEKWAKEQFELNKIKDQIKRDYCKNNNIILIEIPYWEYNNIEKILERELNV